MRSKRFENPHIEGIKRGFFDAIRWKLGCYEDSHLFPPPPEDFIYPTLVDSYDPELPSVTWIGHSTFLIEVNGITFLTDPVWDLYCAPIHLEIFKRKHQPPIALSDLPRIDFVLISHNHYDHLDAKTVKYLRAFQPQIQWIIPTGLSSWFQTRNITDVTELKWWEHKQSQEVTITATPAQHFSGRSLWDQNKTHWNGYVCEIGQKRFYFTGDTGYNSVDFKEIGKKWPYMDLSLIPIGTYVPVQFMKPVHCSPWEAVEIHLDVNSRFSIGMHWNTFSLSEEPHNRPPYDLYLTMSEKKLPYETFLPMDPGIQVNW